MALSRLTTSDGAPLTTSDGSPIYVSGGPNPSGCLIPLANSARPSEQLGPPPNPVNPLQFSPAGLVATPILSRTLQALRPPQPDDASPTAYAPLDRLSYVETALATYVIPGSGTPGEKAFAALELILTELYSGAGDGVGFLRWSGSGTPSDDLTAVRAADGLRYWANIVAYDDGAFYWVLGGLGGYGLEAYWRFGGLTDPGLYVPYS